MTEAGAQRQATNAQCNDLVRRKKIRGCFADCSPCVQGLPVRGQKTKTNARTRKGKLLFSICWVMDVLFWFHSAACTTSWGWGAALLACRIAFWGTRKHSAVMGNADIFVPTHILLLRAITAFLYQHTFSCKGQCRQFCTGTQSPVKGNSGSFVPTHILKYRAMPAFLYQYTISCQGQCRTAEWSRR